MSFGIRGALPPSLSPLHAILVSPSCARTKLGTASFDLFSSAYCWFCAGNCRGGTLHNCCCSLEHRASECGPLLHKLKWVGNSTSSLGYQLGQDCCAQAQRRPRDRILSDHCLYAWARRGAASCPVLDLCLYSLFHRFCAMHLVACFSISIHLKSQNQYWQALLWHMPMVAHYPRGPCLSTAPVPKNYGPPSGWG